MSEAGTSETPKAAVSALLDSLGIKEVIFVDDLFAKRVNLADVQAAQLSLPAERVKEVIGVAELNFPDDIDIRRQVFERFWGQQDSDAQENLGRRILAATSGGDSVRPEDADAARALSDVVGKERLRTLSPQEWGDQRDAILSKAKVGGALLLFDQDLRADSGTANGGMMIIAAIMAGVDVGSIMCGLLTHTVQMANESEAWQSLAKEHGVNSDRFIVIAKENLKTDPMQFARMLKLVALLPDCREMKTRVHQILVESATEAAKQVEAIDVFDFEHAVLRVAHDEGMWEPDMLFRLFGIFQRTELLRRAYTDNELELLTRRLRSVSNIPTDSPRKQKLSTWKLQQRDMFESGEHINRLHLPIEIGDVFAKTDGNAAKHFILLGQPCDLMVRPNGERRPKVNQVLLGEIQVVETPSRYDEIIPYFGDDPASKHYVRFKRIHSVPVIVLDLCVFNDDGVARLPEVCPDRLTPAWAARHAEVKKRLSAAIDEYDKFGSGKAAENVLMNLRSSLFEMFPPVVGKDSLFRPTLETVDEKRTLIFNCVRVKRLHRPRAAALALYYASCFSRPAFDRDLGEGDDATLG
jgi:hypothetical protein